jgi:hypothetical protein
VNAEKAAEEEKPDVDDNAKTIRPAKSPLRNVIPLPSRGSDSDIEDYSDLAGEDEDLHLKAKVADFKVRSMTSPLSGNLMFMVIAGEELGQELIISS